MSGPLRTSVRKPRGRVRPELVYLGWQHAPTLTELGPMPAPPAEAKLDEVSADWIRAQRRVQARLDRPARLACAVAGAVAAAAAVCWQAGVMPAWAGLTLTVTGVCLAARFARQLIRTSRALRVQIQSEYQRVARIRAVQQARHLDLAEAHAQACRDWQRLSAAQRREPRWYPATVPVEVSRLDLAGGTASGWSALLTMIGSTRLAVGGAMTVLDMTEGTVATDLIAVARHLGIDPLVFVLPADLPALSLGSELDSEQLAEALALTAAAEPDGESDPARDAALLTEVMAVLGPDATMHQVIAALRVLAQLGGPRPQHGADPLTGEQMTRLTAIWGRGSAHLGVERAWQLQTRLRVLAPLGSSPARMASSQLRVAWPDRGATPSAAMMLGRYLVAACTQTLRQAPVSQPWLQSMCVLGAERLPANMIDQLCDAAEGAGAGLLLGYRSIPPRVRERLGRGNAAVAFMRLGNAEDARAAAEQIGTEYRFVVSQLTDTIGASVTHTAGDTYTSTVGSADSVSRAVTESRTVGRSRGHGHSRTAGLAPLAESGSVSRDASTSTAASDSRSVSEGINVGTSWGASTSAALGVSGSLAGSVQRSRELLIEPHELQHLPHTAVVVCQHSPAGRQVLLADANPAIMTLPTATLSRLPDPAARQHRPLGSRP